mgnify:CR=1 FL=1
MEIIISNSSDKPIYEQIAMQIKSLIMNGTLSAGEALPSMRALAKRPAYKCYYCSTSLRRFNSRWVYRNRIGKKVVLLHHQIKNLFKKNNYE